MRRQTSWQCGSEARVGPCEARGLIREFDRARVAMRGFQSGRRFLLASCGGRAKNTRTLRKDKGSERPSLMLNGSKAGNARILRQDEGQERPSLRLNGGRAENARTLRKDEGRERPSLQWADSKAENTRAFDIGNKEPRTPVLFMDQAVAENTRASSSMDRIWSWLLRAGPFYTRGYGVVAAQSGVYWTHGAGRAACGANARRGARAVRARGACYLQCSLTS